MKADQFITRAVKCKIRLDRLKFGAVGRGAKPPHIGGFQVLSDFRPHLLGEMATYDRLRKLRSCTDSCRINIAYRPRCPWLQDWYITMIGDDRSGIQRNQLDAVLTKCHHHRLSLFELAFDFSPTSGIDRSFVLKYGRFGKSRRHRDRERDGLLRFGTRKSTKLVRCYWKGEVNAYRVELELHAALLRRYGVSKVGDLGYLCRWFLKSHFRFLRISWTALNVHLTRRFGDEGEVLLVTTQLKAAKSLQSALDFLKRAGVSNTHRFLRPLRMNDEIESALRNWLVHFCRAEGQGMVVYP